MPHAALSFWQKVSADLAHVVLNFSSTDALYCKLRIENQQAHEVDRVIYTRGSSIWNLYVKPLSIIGGKGVKLFS